MQAVPLNKSNDFITVADALGVDNDRLWYYIPGFNGYEVSDDGYIRSMKHYRKYPFGILVRPKRNKKKEIMYPLRYELSDNNNERRVVTLEYIQYLAKTNPTPAHGYPRKTYILDIASRNQRCTIKKKTKALHSGNDIIYPKFSFLKEEIIEEDKVPEIICPIEPINGGTEYYGRENHRPSFHFDV